MNQNQLDTLLRQHHREAYLWARQCCGFDGEMAKDVVQMVYLKILDGQAKLKEDRNAKTWLFSIIRFTAIDELRKTGKWSSIENEPDLVFEEIELDETNYEGLVKRLPKMQQEVMLMVFYHDMTLEQTAEVLQLHIGTVRTHYERGKKRLKEWIEFQRKTEIK